MFNGHLTGDLEFVHMAKGASAGPGDITAIQEKMATHHQLRKLKPAYRSIVGAEVRAVGLIAKSIAWTKQSLSKFDVFQIKTTFNRLRNSDALLIQAAEEFFKIRGQPYLSEVVDAETFASIKDDKDYCKAVSTAIRKGSLRNSTSVKLAEAIALDRFKSSAEPKVRIQGLSLYLDFCLKMMNVKYFERFRTMLEKECANKPLAT